MRADPEIRNNQDKSHLQLPKVNHSMETETE
jgi:hypothetical protein